MPVREAGRTAYERRGDVMEVSKKLPTPRPSDVLQHIRRAPQDAGDETPQAGGGLASGRGDAIGGGGQGTASTPAATGGLAPTRGDQQDTAEAGGPSSSDNPAPTDPAPAPTNTWGQNNNGGWQPDPTPSPWTDNNNGGNQDGQSENNQWTQPASSQQQQQQQDQWQQPSSSSSQNNWNTWESQNNGNNGENTWQNTQEQNTWQAVSSSNGGNQAEPSQSSSPSAVSDTISQSDVQPSPSSSVLPSVSSGIIDTSNTVDQDGVASDASMTGSKSSRLGAGATAGIVLAVIALLALFAGVYVYRRRRRTAQSADEAEFGNTGFMSERFSTGSNFYQVPNASTTSGGFITFHDNTSTHTDMHFAGSVGSIIHHSPTLTAAPPPIATALEPRREQPDDDDASHYDQDTVDGHHGDLGRPSSAYYGNTSSPYDGMQSQRMPVYDLPTPPVQAYDGEEAIISSRSGSNSMAYIPSGRAGTRPTPADRGDMNRSLPSQNSYVDEDLRDLYTRHY